MKLVTTLPTHNWVHIPCYSGILDALVCSS